MKIRRRKYLVNKPVQLRYIALVWVPIVILLTALYYLMYYSFFYQMLIPEAVTATLIPAMKHVNLVLFFSLPVIFFILIRIALVWSNRIFGPLPRLEKELDKALADDSSVRLKVRDKDELKGFISKINLVLEKLDKG